MKWAAVVLVALAVFLVPYQAPEAIKPHLCPSPLAIHGVGSNLRTYRTEIDLCADPRRKP